MFHFILTCYIKNEWRIYATPIRHIQNLRTDPQKSSENEKWRIYATSIRHLIKPFSATNLYSLYDQNKRKVVHNMSRFYK